MVKVGEATPGVGESPKKRSRRRRLGALRWVIAVVVVVAIAVAGYFAYVSLLAPTAPVAAPRTVDATRGTIAATVSATGTVAALNIARLNFRTNGRVTEVLVKTGDKVTKDQPLVKLDTFDLALQVTQARAQLKTAEAKLANTKAGSRAEDIAAAQAQLAAAKTRLDMMLAGGRAEDIESARASLASAKAKLSQLKAGPTEVDLRSAEQAVVSATVAILKAEADLANVKAGPSSEDLRGTELAIEQAKIGLWSAQLDRDGTCGKVGFAVAQYQCDSANAKVSSSELSLAVAVNNQARLKAPKRAEDLAVAEKGVESARAQVATAEAKLKQLRAGPSVEDLVVAQASVTQAELQLTLKQRPYTDAEILAQRQAVAQAEAGLVAKQSPYTEADLRSAEATLEQAKAQLETAELNLANATLVAPFNGVVSAANANVGEISAGSAASPTVALVNPDELRLDVTVDEADIGRVAVGQRTTVTFDSIPGRPFQGQVIAVAPNAVMQSGVATYQVMISLRGATQIRPGMTGNASIVHTQAENVVMVPNRALKTRGRERVVEVEVHGKVEDRQVRVGISNDQFSEILEGVAEGDKVVIPSTTTAQPRIGGQGGGPGMGMGGFER